MAKKRFEEDGTPLQHTFDTMEFDHLGKKVVLKVGGLEVEKRTELQKIVQNFLDNSEAPSMPKLDSYKAIGIKKNKADGTWDTIYVSFDKMALHGVPYYKVTDVKVLETSGNIFGAQDSFKINAASKVLKHE